MAFPGDLKVVKVGDIDAPPPEEQTLLWPANTSTPDTSDLALDQFLLKSTGHLPICSGGWTVHHNEKVLKSQIEECELPAEGGVPENWPQIPQLCRRRSCEASGERTNCVNKAIEHLQLLQEVLSDWVVKTEASKNRDVESKLTICENDDEDEEGGVSTEEEGAFPRKESITPSSSEEDESVRKERALLQFIRNIGDSKLSTYESHSKEPEGTLVPLTNEIVPFAGIEALKDYNNHNQLKAVVKEVMLLLAWLHDDCQRTEAKLLSEKALAAQLSTKIDEMSRRKINDITIAVQREHDIFKEKNQPCLVQLAYLNRIHTTCQNKMKAVQNLNYHLKKNIAIRNEQIPLVQDKMALENENIEKIQKAYKEAEKMMIETRKNLAETQAKFEEAKKIIKHEEFIINQQVNAVCHDFNKIVNAADSAEKSFYSMTQGIVDGQEIIKQNEQEEVIMKVKLDNSQAKFNTLQVQNKGEKDNLIGNLKETKQMRTENKKIEGDIEVAKTQQTHKLLDMDKMKLELEKQLRELMQKNQVKVDNIERIEQQIEESKKQKSFYEKNLKRMVHDIMKTESQITLTRDEIQHMENVNKAVLNDIDKEHLRNLEKEKALQQTIDQIRSEIELENNAYLDMSNKINDLEFELRNLKADAKEEKEKLLSKIQESTVAKQKLQEKFEKLTCLKAQKFQALENLVERRNSINEKFEKITKDNEEYIAMLTPYRQMSENKTRTLEDKIAEMTIGEDKMKMEIDLMKMQGQALEASLAKLKESIAKIQETLNEMNLQYAAMFKSCGETKIRWIEVIERINIEMKDHDDLMRQRREVLAEIMQKKQQGFEENEKLASLYRTAQADLVQEKNLYVKLSEETFLLRQAIKDIKQLLKLQIKVDYNMKTLSNYRDLFHSKQLDFFVDESQSSQNKILRLQTEMNLKLEQMSTNLNEISIEISQKKRNSLPKIELTIS